jgi:hypothetical protein
MDYFTTHLHGPSGLIVSLLLVTIRQPVVTARTQVNVMPYASGTYPIFYFVQFIFFILSPPNKFFYYYYYFSTPFLKSPPAGTRFEAGPHFEFSLYILTCIIYESRDFDGV